MAVGVLHLRLTGALCTGCGGRYGGPGGSATAQRCVGYRCLLAVVCAC